MKHPLISREDSRSLIRPSRQQTTTTALGLAALALVGCGATHPTASSGDSGTAGSGGSPSASSSAAASNPTLAAQVHSWATRYSSPSLKALGSDLSRFASDAQSQNLPAVKSDCQQLRTDVASAKAGPPDPDSRSQKHWSAALSELASAANECVTGAASSDATLVNEGDDEMGKAGAQFQIFAREVKQLYG